MTDSPIARDLAYLIGLQFVDPHGRIRTIAKIDPIFLVPLDKTGDVVSWDWPPNPHHLPTLALAWAMSQVPGVA